MKIRQAQTSATYILPDPGELNKRVLIRQRVDMPADNFGVEPQYPVAFRAWAKVIQTSATTWQETAQTGDAITHHSLPGGSLLIMRWSVMTVCTG
ncbi:phage protein [Escherichia coli]|nr:phage protein [Escherichia coli]